MTKFFPKHCVFFVFYCGCAFKYHAGANCLMGCRESFENGRGYGKCGRECLSVPGNIALFMQSRCIAMYCRWQQKNTNGAEITIRRNTKVFDTKQTSPE
jgi:hypothetical protein